LLLKNVNAGRSKLVFVSIRPKPKFTAGTRQNRGQQTQSKERGGQKLFVTLGQPHFAVVSNDFNRALMAVTGTLFSTPPSSNLNDGRN
jgi:hypothetical protein